MANWSGISASLGAILKPHTVQPRLKVSSISQLDWIKFRQQGVTGVVIDKDNCISRPHQDELAPDNPQLHQAWNELIDAFGADNVLIVSNSAGTLAKDPLLIQAEAVSRNLQVPVLVHKSPKPGFPCVRQVATHFYLRSLPRSTHATSPFSRNENETTKSSIEPNQGGRSQIVFSPLARSRNAKRLALSPSTIMPPPTTTTRTGNSPLRLLVIGDRLATDMILSHRLSTISLPLPIPSLSSTSAPTSRLSSLIRSLVRRSSTSSFELPPRELVELGPKRIETIGILTTGLHEREGFGTWFMRKIEMGVVRRLEKKREKERVRRNLRGELEEGIRWEDCLKGAAIQDVRSIANTQELVDQVRIEEEPSTIRATESATSPIASELTTLPPSSASQSYLASKLIATLSTLSTSPRVIPHRIVHFPKHFLSTLSRLPPYLSHLFSRMMYSLLEGLPKVAKWMEGPLEKLKVVYYQPEKISGGRNQTTKTMTLRNGGGLEKENSSTSTIERWIDNVEATLNKAKRVVDTASK